MKCILALCFLLCQTLTTTSFVLPNTSFTTSRISNNKIQNDSVSYKSSSVALPMSIDALNVESMSTDHEKEGSRLAASIAVWLDTEWYPQEIHKGMGESAKQSYITCRENGDVDVMSIMMSVGNDLESKWEKYDDDAFNGAWDVANYVSDYLTKRAGQEGCSCNYEVIEVEGFD